MSLVELVIILFAGAGYFGGIATFLGWCSGARSSHVLPLDALPLCRKSKTNRRKGWQFFWWSLFAAGILALEVIATSELAELLVPEFRCSGSFWPMVNCIIEPSAPSGSVGAVIVGSTAVLLAAHRYIRMRPVYPSVVLLAGIILFGAITDVLGGVGHSASMTAMMQLAASVQFVAAAGFLIAVSILQPPSVATLAWGACAHVGCAVIRIFGIAAMFGLTRHLPPASATAIWLTLMVVPGISTALAPAAVLGVVSAQRG